MNITINDSPVTINVTNNQEPGFTTSPLGGFFGPEELENNTEFQDECIEKTTEVYQHLEEFEGGFAFNQPTEVSSWSCSGELGDPDSNNQTTAVSLYFKGLTLGNQEDGETYNATICLTETQAEDLMVSIHDTLERYRVEKALFEAKHTVRA